MGRADVARKGPLDPASWPAWVMSFGKGYFPDDPGRQAVRLAEFHQWQRDRDAWLAKSGVTWMAVYNEYRRRGIAEVPPGCSTARVEVDGTVSPAYYERPDVPWEES
jgi:hypothetical protein